MSGYIKLYRGVTDNPLWEKEPFSAGQAWIDLLLAANFKDKTIYIRKTKIDVKRGQIAWSMLTMAKRWKWSRGKVMRFLKDLENEQMVVQHTGHLTTLLTICNYEKYQGFDTADGTTDNTADGTAGSTTGGTQHKNVNKGKKVNKYTDDFESVWSEYPKREGSNPKAKAFSAWNARLRDGHSEQDLTDGVRRYARFCRTKDQIGTQFVKQASSFFGPEEYFLESWEVAKPSPIHGGGSGGSTRLDLEQMRKDLGIPAHGVAS